MEEPNEGQKRPEFISPNLITPHSLNVAIRDSQLTSLDNAISRLERSKLYVKKCDSGEITKIRKCRSVYSYLATKDQHRVKVNISTKEKCITRRNRADRRLIEILPTIGLVGLVNKVSNSRRLEIEKTKRTNVYPHILDLILKDKIKPCYTCQSCCNWNTMRDATTNSVLINVLETFRTHRKFKTSKESRSSLIQHYRKKLGYIFSKSSVFRTLFCIISRMSSLLDNDSFIRSSTVITESNITAEIIMKTLTLEYEDSFANHLGLVFASNNRSMCLVYNDEVYTYPRSYLLLIYNKLCDYLSVKILNELSVDEPYNEADVNRFDRFVNSLISLAKNLDLDYFSISKSLEAICIGMDLVETDGVINGKFLKSLLNDLKEKTGHNVEFDEWFNIMMASSMEYRNELSTLTKLMGHPFVKMEEGSIKLHKNTTEELNIDPNAVLDVTRFAKKNFIKAYVERHQKWPELTKTSVENLPPHLLEMYLANKDPEYNKFKYPDSSLHHYDKVEFCKNFEIDYLTSFLPYLKDKTISDKKTEVLRNLFRIEEVEGVVKLEPILNPLRKSRLELLGSTRLLFHYLISHIYELDHKAFTKIYEDKKLWSQILDLMLIRIVPKEKELKELFRGFGCQSYMMRARCLIQETNMKKYLANYCDEQAMTLGELELKRKLKGLRNLKKIFRTSTIIYVNVDADKWNNKFRDELVKPVCKETIDKLYSTTLFSLTQEYYENCYFYVPDGQKCYSWEGQKGGIEGLNQDTWVFVYINSIHYAMSKWNMPYFILCKGDDLRIAVAVPQETLMKISVEAIRSSLVSTVEKACLCVGQTIKKDDSYASVSYFNFNKYASVGPIELPQGFRKIQKVYGENNAMRRGLDLYIAGAYSNGHSACSVSQSPVPCFITSTIWASYYLCNNSQLKDLGITKLSSFLLIPNSLGGFPVIYLHNFLVRGESDLLSSFLNIIHVCVDYNKDLAIHLLKSLHRSNFCDIINEDIFRGILADPYCLPTLKPSNADSVLYTAIRNCLPKITKNEFILALLQENVKKIDKAIIKFFYESEEYDARIMSAIYSSSPTSLLSEFIRKFETSRTIFDCLVVGMGYRNAKNMLAKSLNQEVKMLNWRIKMIKSQDTNILLNMSIFSNELFCPGKVADYLRTLLWKKNVRSVTISPSTHLCEILNTEDEMTLNFDRDEDHRFALHYGGIKKFLSNFIDNGHGNYKKERNKNVYFSYGDYDPFIGTRTNLGLISKDATFVKNNLYIKKIQELLDLYSWCNSEPDLIREKSYSKLIVEFMKFYLEDIEIEHLLPFGRNVRGGTAQHHVRSSGFKEQIIPNTLNNHFSLFNGSSDSHRVIKNLNQHMNINFLHVFTTAIQVIMFCPDPHLIPNFSHDYDLSIITPPCSYCYEPVLSGECMSSIEVPNISSNNSFLRTLFPKFTLDILEESMATHEHSVQRRILGSIRRIQGTFNADKAYILETCLNEKITLMHVLQRYNLSKTRNQDLSVLEGLSGITLTKTSGLTEFKRLNLEESFEILDYLSIHTMHERSIEIRSYSFEEYLDAEFYGLLPYHWLFVKCFQSGRFTELTKSFKFLSRLKEFTSSNIMILSKHITNSVFKLVHLRLPLEIYVNTKEPSKTMRNCIEMYLRSSCHYVLLHYNAFKHSIHVNNDCPVMNSLKSKGFLSPMNIESTVLTMLLFCRCHYHFLNVQRLEEACEQQELPTLAIFYEYTKYSLSSRLVREWDHSVSMDHDIKHLISIYTGIINLDFPIYDRDDDYYDHDGLSAGDNFRADCINTWLCAMNITICEYSMDQVVMALRKRPKSVKINLEEDIDESMTIPTSDIPILRSDLIFFQKLEFTLIPTDLDVMRPIFDNDPDLYEKECLTFYYNSPNIKMECCKLFTENLLLYNDINLFNKVQVIILNDYQGYLTSILYSRYSQSTFYYFTEEVRYEGLSELLYNPETLFKNNPRKNKIMVNSLESTVCMASSSLFKTNLKPLVDDIGKANHPIIAYLPSTSSCSEKIIMKILKNLAEFCYNNSCTIRYLIIEIDILFLSSLCPRIGKGLYLDSNNLYLGLVKSPYTSSSVLLVIENFNSFNDLIEEHFYVSPATYFKVTRFLNEEKEKSQTLHSSIKAFTNTINPGSDIYHKVIPDFTYEKYYGISSTLYLPALQYRTPLHPMTMLQDIEHYMMNAESNIWNEIQDTEKNARPMIEIQVPEKASITRYTDSTRNISDTWDSMTRSTLANKYYRWFLIQGFFAHQMYTKTKSQIYDHGMLDTLRTYYKISLNRVNRRMFPHELRTREDDVFEDAGFSFKPGQWFNRGVFSSIRFLSYLKNKNSQVVN